MIINYHFCCTLYFLLCECMDLCGNNIWFLQVTLETTFQQKDSKLQKIEFRGRVNCQEKSNRWTNSNERIAVLPLKMKYHMRLKLITISNCAEFCSEARRKKCCVCYCLLILYPLQFLRSFKNRFTTQLLSVAQEQVLQDLAPERAVDWREDAALIDWLTDDWKNLHFTNQQPQVAFRRYVRIFV